MVTIHIKKTSDFDTRPEFDIARQARKRLECLIANNADTPTTNYLPGCFKGSYLSKTAATLKANNLSVPKYEESLSCDEGNLILETRLRVLPNLLLVYINLQEIGIVEGRGSFQITPTQDGFWLQAQELDFYKNSLCEEAHALQRTIVRNYAIKGQYAWNSMHHTLMPDGSLHISVNNFCHPALTFPAIHQGPLYSSLVGNPGFPNVDQSNTFGKFANLRPAKVAPKCCQCGGAKSVGVQTCEEPPREFSMTDGFQSLDSLFPCSCNSMEF